LNVALTGRGGTNAVGRGGGMVTPGPEASGSMLLHAVILGHNTPSNCFGIHFTDLGFNISSDNSCPFSAGGSLVNTDPRLGPLSDYGGSTLTMPLLAGSPAIEGAAGAGSPALDQRGHARPFGSAADVGAFESSPPYTVRGHVTGYQVPSGLQVTLAANSTTTD